jgi:hypothetical protein
MAQNMRGMFWHAPAFNQNLCSWGQYLSAGVNFYEIFLGSGCPFQMNPIFTWNPAGPFCQDCPGGTKLPSKQSGPHTMPIVPAAITHLPDGRFMTWSGDRPYTFDEGDFPAGTVTSIFDPATLTATELKVYSTVRTKGLDRSRQRRKAMPFLTVSLFFPSCAESQNVLPGNVAP